MKLKATIVNHSGKPQSELRVLVKEPGATDGVSGGVSVTSGGVSSPSFTSAPPIHAAGVVSLEGGTGKTENAGITVRVTQSCTYTSDIDPKDASPGVPH